MELDRALGREIQLNLWLPGVPAVQVPRANARNAEVWTSTGMIQLTFSSHSKPVAKSRVVLKYKILHPFV